MRHLIESVNLPGLGDTQLIGLTLIVGPNSSGKTQFLKDLLRDRTSEKYVVCKSIRFAPPVDLDSFIGELISRQLIRRDPGGQGDLGILRVLTPELGVRKAIHGREAQISAVRTWHRDWGGKPENSRAFAHFFGPLLCASLSLLNRLELTSETKSFDHMAAIPSDEIQALHINSKGQDELNNEVGRAFGRSVSIDSTRGNLLTLQIGEDRADGAPRIRPNELRDFVPIAQEGDGLKSYVAICMTLLASYRPLCLIDEPELCLHPPQAYSLGQFVGRHSLDHERTTIVATHSSHFVRGIIEESKTVTIIRLSRYRGQFIAHRVPYNKLEDATKRPAVRADQVLDGLFSDGVVIVEADTDRTVYQAAFQAGKRNKRHLDPGFIAVGGTGGIASTAAFFRTLRIPTAIIADLDLLTRPESELRPVLQSICTQPEEIDEILALISKVRQAILAIPPTEPPGEVAAELSCWTNPSLTWDGDNDVQFIRALRNLANRVDRARKLKGGIDALESRPEILAQVESLISRCAAFGLFLAPVGELECWMPLLMTEISRHDKSSWANEAIGRIWASPEKACDIIDFVGSVVEKLDSERIAAFGAE